jgi:hypothetical protein
LGTLAQFDADNESGSTQHSRAKEERSGREKSGIGVPRGSYKNSKTGAKMEFKI